MLPAPLADYLGAMARGASCLPPPLLASLHGALRHLAVRPYARRARRAALARAAGRGGPPGALQLQGLRRGGAGRQDDDSRRGSVSAAAARSRRPSVRRPSFR